ncbi:hypothetical protein B0H21DRAFT_821956 [Amylocystis lapponica]|nr:hypothetical protein B0H21DRAFT_821956 [Amylocystis lapponica]
MKFQKMDMISVGMDFDVIRKAITAGYFHQAARVKGIGEFIDIRTGLPTHLHPTNSPTYELILTSEDMTQDTYPAAELDSVFYSVKEKDFDDCVNRRAADREFSKKAELETEMTRHHAETVEKAQEDALVVKIPSRSQIIVPATPRYIDAGAPGSGNGIISTKGKWSSILLLEAYLDRVDSPRIERGKPNAMQYQILLWHVLSRSLLGETLEPV